MSNTCLRLALLPLLAALAEWCARNNMEFIDHLDVMSRMLQLDASGDMIRHEGEFLSAIEDPRIGRDKLDKLSQPVQNDGRSYPGFNLFDADDEALFSPSRAASSISAACRTKPCADFYKVGHTYKYYLTRFGKVMITTGLKLRELAIIPQLALNSAV